MYRKATKECESHHVDENGELREFRYDQTREALVRKMGNTLNL